MSPKNFQQTVGQMVYFSDQVFWTISKINDLPKNYCYRSPTFSFMGSMWRLLLWNSKEWLDMGIEFLSLAADRKIVKFGIKGSSLEICKIHEITDLPDKFPIIHRSSLKLHGNDWLPDGDLFIFLGVGENFKANAICQVKEKIGNKECEKTGRENSAEAFSQTDEGSGEMECENSIDNIDMKVPLQSEAEICAKKLQDDLKEIMLSEDISDVTLKVKDLEFRVHRCILAARSPAFMALMKRDSKQKASVIIDIDDVDPNTFSDFLLYIYTGSLEHLTANNAPNLYLTAEKYEINELKNACLNYMLKNNISLENFCDVLSLSIRHDEKKLFEVCVSYFLENSLQIVMTSKWQEFLMENPIVGNELYIKELRTRRH